MGKKLGISKEQRLLSDKYAKRFNLFNHKLVVARRGTRRTLYLLGHDEDDVEYRIRFDKVRAMRRIKGQNQVINKAHYFKVQARQVHGEEKYDYSMINESNISSREKMPIICDQHGIFYKDKRHHITDRAGCPVCAKERENKKRRFYKNEY